MNLCVFTGWLASKPEIKEVNDTRVVRFRLQVRRSFRKNGGTEWGTRTTYLSMEAWDSAADVIARDFDEGDPIYITDSSAESRVYEVDGQKRRAEFFRVNSFCRPDVLEEQQHQEDRQVIPMGKPRNQQQQQQQAGIPF